MQKLDDVGFLSASSNDILKPLEKFPGINVNATALYSPFAKLTNVKHQSAMRGVSSNSFLQWRVKDEDNKGLFQEFDYF